MAVPLNAQNKYLDSLKLELKSPSLTDTSKIDLLIMLGDRLGYSNSGEAMEYLRQAYQLADKHNLYIQMGDALTGMGQTYYRTDNLDSCMYFLRCADSFFKMSYSDRAKLSQIGSKMNMATVLRTKGDFTTALTMYLEGLDSMLHHRNLSGMDMKLVIAYMNIGLVYNEFGQYDKALFYHREGVNLADEKKLTDVRVYYLKLHMIHDFIELKSYDSAKCYMEKLDKNFRDLNQPDILSQLYSNWGMYYMGIHQPDEALNALMQSYKYAVASKNKFRQEGMLARIAAIYKDKNDYSRGIVYYQKAFDVSRQIGNKPTELNYLKNLAELHARLHHHEKAVGFYQQYIHLSDSLNETSTKKQINEIENKYQAKQKQDSILVLQKNNQIQSLALNKRKNLNNVLLIGIVFLIILSLLSYRNLHQRHHILKQNEILNKQRIQELEKEHQLVAMQSVLKGQEEERSRLAKDLHDGVGGLLSGVKLNLLTMKGNVFLTEENAQSMNNVIVQLDQSIAELRRVSHNMMPESLIKYGLKEALENYCDNLNLSGKIKVQLQAYGMEKRMEQNTEIVLYRIVQELLNNTIRHAEAKNVLIQLSQADDTFNLTVEDDGKGFDISKGAQKGGAGLANIKARAEYLDASVDFRSITGEGTSVSVIGKMI